tara:strand:+ start:939 stop:1085 length:147 start_codon:yes stop_codon:yes gene_type:complete
MKKKEISPKSSNESIMANLLEKYKPKEMVFTIDSNTKNLKQSRAYKPS